MEGGIPMINCLLQHTLRNLCACSDSSSTTSKWAYAVFWRILPRNYPPPKWDNGGGLLDRAKGNKRNWILVWEDGFCDFWECERGGKRRFGADTFFKMTHEVYNFGEGLVGKVASDNTHKWVFRDSPIENDLSSWNVSIDHQPRAWEAQFSSGIETIAIISVREGAIQLGSFNKVVEDVNTVLSIRRKFSYLQSVPGLYPMQRPYAPIENRNTFEDNNCQKLLQSNERSYSGIIDDKHHMVGSKRQNYDQIDDLLPAKSLYLGFNSPQNGNSEALPLWSIPPPFPSMPCNNLSAIFSKIPSALMPYDDALEGGLVNSQNLIPDVDVKVEAPGVREDGVDEDTRSLNQTIRLV
ncbi:hypothetical protein ABFS82_14G257100 [Erythranthe guttata]|uniref:Transcription factor MYC/MYB N-terminal domain-containing protein n=1 Tax=Erythranthe guttata TaxID=4155 RepID=A0A022R776_ERYGU|nr:PREDICTED: uncharacterized protein LOC105959232 isoform X1 [Erythranthe guttata]EYU36327.1 hypothetical protein MIMGU_mgv1a009169mg [Erythranthe guttata]|eukprot:XP_012838742.1 PREDICTED: uncharacterized protein LOC105959232 isoform X1 [Erythranthe guttata]